MPESKASRCAPARLCLSIRLCLVVGSALGVLGRLARQRLLGGGDAAMLRGPGTGILEEAAHLGSGAIGEIRALGAGLQHVPPGAQGMELDVHVGQRAVSAGE